MPDDRGTIRQVAWTELFPWLELLRAFRLATQARLLLLAAVAVMLTFAGWWVAGQMFGGGDPEAPLQTWIAHYTQGPWHQAMPEPTVAEMKRVQPGVLGPPDVIAGPADLAAGENPLLAAWLNLSGPFRQLFAPDLSLVGLAFGLVCALWVDLVWAFFGGVITRLVALQVTKGERGSLRTAVKFVRSRYLAYVTAPLFPLFGVLLFVLPVAVIGLIGRAGTRGLRLSRFCGRCFWSSAW